MAELSAKEGQIGDEESTILKNLLLLRETSVKNAMTPRTVIFSLSNNLLVEEFFHKYDQTPFSRILIYSGDKDNITGFVMRHDLLLAQARGNGKKKLKKYRRKIGAIHTTASLAQSFSEMIRKKAQIKLIVDEYGTVQGILTLEDLFETLLGLEIIDEKDESNDMQQLAKKQWIKKAEKKGYELNN